MATGLVWHELYMWHDTGNGAGVIPAGLTVQPLGHLENAEGKRRIRNLVEVSGLIDRLVQLKPRPATEDEILRLHTKDYVERIKDASSKLGGDAGDLTPFGPSSYEIALLAVGGCITAVDAVLDGKVDNAYALVRPPGHHAERDTGRGFCIFGNVALAAIHARQVRGLSRVAIVDWDVHHGNGTEHAFYDDPTVLTISIHQNNNYPANSGAITDKGRGEGEGYNINVPLPPGSGVGAYVGRAGPPRLQPRAHPHRLRARCERDGPAGFDDDDKRRVPQADACHARGGKRLVRRPPRRVP